MHILWLQPIRLIKNAKRNITETKLQCPKWLSSLTTWSYIQLPFHIISFLNVLNLIQHHFPNSPSANASLSVSNFLMSVLLIVGSEHRRGHFEIDGIKITATAAALVTGEYANRIIYLCMKAIMQKLITSRHVFKKDTFCTGGWGEGTCSALYKFTPFSVLRCVTQPFSVSL